MADIGRRLAPGLDIPNVRHSPSGAIRELTFIASLSRCACCRARDRLFMIAEVSADWPRPIPADLQEADARWQATMDRFQQRLACAEADQKWVPMRRIFSLDPS